MGQEASGVAPAGTGGMARCGSVRGGPSLSDTPRAAVRHAHGDARTTRISSVADVDVRRSSPRVPRPLSVPNLRQIDNAQIYPWPKRLAKRTALRWMHATPKAGEDDRRAAPHATKAPQWVAGPERGRCGASGSALKRGRHRTPQRTSGKWARVPVRADQGTLQLRRLGCTSIGPETCAAVSASLQRDHDD
ncbi:hypothetical protein VTO73DRAFT_10126 [Trametes versicolor]